MTAPSPDRPATSASPAWLAAAMAGAVGPALALLLLADPSHPETLAVLGGPVLAVGMMGSGMIAAAIAGRLWAGIGLALLSGTGLALLALALGMPPQLDPLSAGLALVVASLSFAARGALFARSAAEKGWWIAVAVVAGEAAIVATAWAQPDALPRWLLVLLPAQWASTAVQTAFAGAGTLAAGAALLALGGTAATTLLVAALWPRRWPYALMFGGWLGFAALVYHHPAPATFRADPAALAAPAMTVSAKSGQKPGNLALMAH